MLFDLKILYIGEEKRFNTGLQIPLNDLHTSVQFSQCANLVEKEK